MFLLLLGLTTSAIAQDKDENVIYNSRTEIDFEGVDVEGQLVKPQGSLILDRQTARFNPLIKLRTDFNPEMSMSINEIK
jgi:hypothetical protein